MKAPNSGLALTSDSSFILVVFVYSVDLSKAHPLVRQHCCTRAARYVSGICMPESHMHLGSPTVTHLSYCRKRRWKCVIQLASLILVAGAFFIHDGGMVALYRAFSTSSSSWLIPTSPTS